jgi:hypothetical protein
MKANAFYYAAFAGTGGRHQEFIVPFATTKTVKPCTISTVIRKKIIELMFVTVAKPT